MDWSAVRDDFGKDLSQWQHAGSNLLLDFHGDPSTAELVIFSDGNHHMALKEAIEAFGRTPSGTRGVFYATTPPGPILTLLQQRRLQLGNFILSACPHIFIGPPHILEHLVETGHISGHGPFVRNQGNVLLVKRGNPKGISSLEDLKRSDVTVFLSNPGTEAASHRGYCDTLVNLTGDEKIVASLRTVYGERIHHREAPEAVAGGSADAALIFYHLALYFTRCFPNDFDIVPLGGTAQRPNPLEGNPVAHTHVGLVGDGGPFGRAFFDFLASDHVGAIYLRHGLIPL